ncbi:Gfo/Idh/MocA family protein [Vibrio ziniensis]|uniref:Gfo/Idh/MocA family oxidoreductase n=1 Tax=Vibrio ziniensis TaxID=2711221 RepID=A0A6G7CPI3_9VIBR|nr:Gfo/Idh/MocA family oxidoreductase [Vibrio ziniensis]QIH44015.1 Gfo/Idh/MocA family oxidoreductase [Vibrio ziniensis]
MANQTIRVGFIGLNPDSHWAATAHLPALQSLGNKYSVVAVANSSLESSERTAKALNLPYAFASAEELVKSDEVDLVVVTVKVPYHFELVSAALNAGKHVYCEWPLGNGLQEARLLTALAESKGVVAVSGTQARTALEIEHLSKLIADGYVGKVLSSTLIGSGGNWSGETIEEYYYLFEEKNGANMQTIPLAHTLAAVKDVLGGFAQLNAQFVSNFSTVKVSDANETREKSVPDQIMVQGQLESGAAISIHYRGGVSRGTNLLWEINGTEGDIQVTADLGHAQMVQLTVKGANGDAKQLEPLIPEQSLYEGLPKFAAARNIAVIYDRLYNDIQNGTATAPTFADAVRLHEIIDAIEKSAANK